MRLWWKRSDEREVHGEPQIEYSEEVVEIMGYVPNRILRQGISIIFLIMAGTLLGSYLFKLPEIISTKVILTTSNPPAPLIAKETSRIRNLYVADGARVEKGALIATLESTLDERELFDLEHKLNTLGNNREAEVLALQLSENVNLGAVQADYLRFYGSIQKLKDILTRNSYGQRIAMQQQLIKMNEDHLNEIMKQADIKEGKYQIAKRLFSQDSLLFSQGVLARRDYDESAARYLQEKEGYLAFFASLKNLKTSIAQMEESVLNLRLGLGDEVRTTKIQLLQDLQLLRSQIENYKNQFCFYAPIKGMVSLTKYWSTNQVIKQGERLATVIAHDEGSIMGIAHIPSAALGKVEAGLHVKIKLSGFPYMRYGIVEGVIRKISQIPDADGYVAEIVLSKGMTSNYKEQLKFVQEMDGTAEIITKDVPLLYRLIDPFKSLIHN